MSPDSTQNHSSYPQTPNTVHGVNDRGIKNHIKADNGGGIGGWWHERYIVRLAVVQLILWSGFFYAFSASVPMMAQQTGWAIDHFFYALTIGFMVWAAFSPMAGYYIDRGYGATLMQIANTIGAGLLATIAITQSPIVLYGCMVALGIPMAFTLYDPAFTLLMRKLSDPERASNAILGVTLIAGMATLLVYPTITLLEPLVGWRAIFGGLAVLVLMCLFIFPHRALQDTPPNIPKNTNNKPSPPISQYHPQQTLQGYGRNTFFPCLILGFSFGFAILAHTMLIFQLPTYLTMATPYGAWAVLLLLLGPSQILGRLLLPLLKRYFTVYFIGILVFALMAITTGLIWATQASPTTLWLALVGQGMAYGLSTVIRPMMAQHYFPMAILGKIIGTMAMIGLGFMALSPAVGGFLLLHLGFHTLFAVLVTCQCLSILGLLWFMTIRYSKSRI